MNDLSISTTFIPDRKPLREALELCKQANFRSVEIGSNHCFEKSYDYLEDFSFQYLVHNYFPIPKDSFVLNIASFDENIRFKSIQHIKRAIDFCNQLGGHLYTFHPGFLTDPKGSNNTKKNYDFQWEENQLPRINHIKAKDLMFRAIDEAVDYAQTKNVKIAIETEGSLNKKDHLLMQTPEEYIDFMSKYSSLEIGINLNIGHLNLASNAFQFKKKDFIDLISDYIVAMELSHNNGLEDQHLPLLSDGWYWSFIQDIRFIDVFKIMEFRNTTIEDVVENIKLFNSKVYAI